MWYFSNWVLWAYHCRTVVKSNQFIAQTSMIIRCFHDVCLVLHICLLSFSLICLPSILHQWIGLIRQDSTMTRPQHSITEIIIALEKPRFFSMIWRPRDGHMMVKWRSNGAFMGHQASTIKRTKHIAINAVLTILIRKWYDPDIASNFKSIIF